MEEVIKKLQEVFEQNNYVDRHDKIACAIGYLEACDDADIEEAIQILRKILVGEI